MTNADETPLCTIIAGRLWQSGCPVSWEHVRAAGINATVQVGHEAQPWLQEWRDWLWMGFHPPKEVRQFAYLALPLCDALSALDVTACDVAITAALLLLTDPGRRVLVHCDAGAFRSIHVCAGIVSAMERCTGAEAFRRVDRRTGAKNPRSSLGMKGWHEHARSFGERG